MICSLFEKYHCVTLRVICIFCFDSDESLPSQESRLGDSGHTFVSTNLTIFADTIWKKGGVIFCVQILNPHRPPFTVKGESIWKQCANIGRRELISIMKGQMREWTPTVRMSKIMLYDQLIWMLCHIKRKNEVGVIMWLWGSRHGNAHCPEDMLIWSGLWTVSVAEVSSNSKLTCYGVACE